MNYKPYSPEWHRYRYLKESIDKYLDDGIDPTNIVDDIRDILHVRSELAYLEFTRINQLEHYLSED
jgi:hypothetical protein